MKKILKSFWGCIPAIFLLLCIIAIAVIKEVMGYTLRIVPRSILIFAEVGSFGILLLWANLKCYTFAKKSNKLISYIIARAIRIFSITIWGITFLVSAFIVAYTYNPEHIVVRNEIKMVATVHSFLEEQVDYYQYKNPFFHGKWLGYENYGNGSGDPFIDVPHRTPKSWTFYDLDGNVIESGTSEENEQNSYLEQKDGLSLKYLDIDAETSERLRKDCEEIATLCNELMINGESEKMQYFPYGTTLTQEAIDKVEEELAKSGYSVINSDSVYPKYLDNSDGLRKFFELSDHGKAAEQSMISVSMYNAIYYFTFQYDGTEMYYISTSINWDENGEYEILEPSKQKLIDWGMTYNGYFYYQLVELDRHWNACSSIRLQPVDKELYDLYVKYLSPANYPSCVFTKDWDRQSYKEICFNDLFENFYRAKSGEYVYADDYDRYTDMSCSLIPASIFEDTILPYFDIPLDEFRTLTLYMADTNSYPWQELNCSNVIYCPWLTPEVTGKRDNGDGTFTITVDILCFDYKCFPRFTHEITIKPNHDGSFQYIANRVTYADEHGVPATTPRLVKQRDMAN